MINFYEGAIKEEIGTKMAKIGKKERRRDGETECHDMRECCLGSAKINSQIFSVQALTRQGAKIKEYPKKYVSILIL